MENENSLDQFVPEHVFLYVLRGTESCYDGNKRQALKAGESYLIRKNSFLRYNPVNREDEFEIMTICFDEEFLKKFQEKHKSKAMQFNSTETFVRIKRNEMIPNFMHSLNPYCDSSGKLAEAFVNVKHEELLIILLQNQPELSGVFFDYGMPSKINLEEYMNRNYKFNVSIEEFSCLTGRSLSAFKRDFKTIFKITPNRWLIQKRLQEAYFLIDQENKKPSEIYLDMGFESFSHFSFAFKKLFGIAPTELTEEKKDSNHKKNKVMNY